MHTATAALPSVLTRRRRRVQSGRTAILFAAENGSLPIVKALVERGAKTDAVDNVCCCIALQLLCAHSLG